MLRRSPQNSRKCPAGAPWRRVLAAVAVAAAALSLAAMAEAAVRKGGRGPAAGPAAAHRGPVGVNRFGGAAGPARATARPTFSRPAGQPAAARATGRPAFSHSSVSRPGMHPGRTGAFGQRGPAGQRFGARRGPAQFGRNAAMAAGRGRYGPLPGQPGFTGVPPAGETRFVQNEMVVHIGSDVSPQAVQNMATRLGLTRVSSQNFDLVGRSLYRFRITSGRSVADVIRAMEAEKISVTAQPNYVFRLQQDLNAARRTAATDSVQYVLAKWRLNDVHRVAKGSNVLVAMIDSEVDQSHPDLDGAIAGRLEPIGIAFKPQPHGTGMAGAMASHRRLIGVAPGARILAVNAFGTDSEGIYGTTEQILKGIDWAISKGARVINMSFAGPRDPLVQLALKKAYDKGIVLVAAAGNAGPQSDPLFPAADPNVIAVTATDINDALLPQANRGSHISVAAPGVDILVPAPNAQYQITSGTSVAAAHVSGVVALMIERKPDATPAAVRQALQTTAKDLGPRGRDDQFGWGLVDPYLAMLALDINNLGNARAAAPVPQQ